MPERRRRPVDRAAGRSQNSYYVDGSTVHKIYEQPVRIVQPRIVEPEIPVRPKERPRPVTSKETQKNREKAKSINLGYVLFLTAASVLLVLVCSNYIKLQSSLSEAAKEISKMESQITEVKTVNDATYNKLLSSVDLEEIKRIAIEDLGMIYCNESQVKLYDSQDSDYVRQYKDIPSE